MPAKSKIPTYAAPSRLFLIAPILLAPLGIFMVNRSNGTPQVGSAVLLLVAIDIVTIYVKQIAYLKRTQQNKRLLFQSTLVVGALVVPFIAAVVGDFGGASAYSTPVYGSGDLWGLAVGAILAFVFTYGCIVANEVYISAGKQRSTIRNIVGKVFYVIGCILVAAVAFFAYSFTYSLHDPSTE